MPAAVLHAPGDLRIEEVEVPTPGPGEVRIRVGVCGVCGSDATEFGRGLVLARPPVVLGHEFAGVVEAVGPGVDGPAPGATVVCGAGVSCGACRPCRRGRTNLCTTYRTLGFALDGGLARYVVAPAATTVDVTAARLPMDTLGLAQPMAIAVHTVRRSGLRAGDDAVIVGAGGIGSFIVVAAAAVGARVLVVDRHEERRRIAEALGATAALADGDLLPEALHELGFDPDVLFEVTGSVTGLRTVLALAGRGATVVPVGVQRADPAVPLGRWTLDEIAVVGTVAHVVASDLPEAVRLLAARPDWSDIAPTVWPLDRLIPDVLQPLLDGGSRPVKALIDPWATTSRAAVHVR
ncbi:zinc-dependent alcohol dehydrogenase [Pseudolysinimonas sp.]|uniref:zinc-dependent alcohol dehydrogenase n=1 Tax=Pseudolysinimonas sp. TaxID=2680009 RepID=UPI003F7F1C3A